MIQEAVPDEIYIISFPDVSIVHQVNILPITNMESYWSNRVLLPLPELITNDSRSCTSEIYIKVFDLSIVHK